MINTCDVQHINSSRNIIQLKLSYQSHPELNKKKLSRLAISKSAHAEGGQSKNIPFDFLKAKQNWYTCMVYLDSAAFIMFVRLKKKQTRYVILNSQEIRCLAP